MRYSVVSGLYLGCSVSSVSSVTRIGRAFIVDGRIAKTPEESDFTSVKARVENANERRTLADIVDQPADRTQHDVALEDDSFWLVPIEERREQGGTRKGFRHT